MILGFFTCQDMAAQSYKRLRARRHSDGLTSPHYPMSLTSDEAPRVTESIPSHYIIRKTVDNNMFTVVIDAPLLAGKGSDDDACGFEPWK